MFYVKIHNGSNSVVAICDEKLVGKKFCEGKVCLKVSEYFYKGNKMGIKDVEKIMLNAGNMNLVGEKSVNLALNLGLIKKEFIMKINGVLHAQLCAF